MPTLLQVNSTVGRGSTGRIAEIIATLAKNKGWKSYIAHGARFVGESNSTLYQVSGKLSEIIHFLYTRFFDRHGLGSLLSTKRLIREINRINPDIVHIHNIHGYYVNYKVLLRYLAKTGIPTVITLHDFWLITGHCAYINPSCEKWKKGCVQCPRLREYPSSYIDASKRNWILKKKLFDSFDISKLVVVPVSNWLKEYVDNSLLRGCHIQTIQNGIDTNLYKPILIGNQDEYDRIDRNKYTILTVADRWTDANGFGEIIELSRILPNDMQIIMVGLNSQQLLDLPPNIIGICHTNNVEQLIILYSSADVLFNASKEVTFGLVTAEAMSCGTPAIVYRGTAGEEIVNEHTGFVIDDISQIPTIVYQCRERKEYYKINCRSRIVEQFDSIKQYSKYIELYMRIIENNIN